MATAEELSLKEGDITKARIPVYSEGRFKWFMDRTALVEILGTSIILDLTRYGVSLLGPYTKVRYLEDVPEREMKAGDISTFPHDYIGFVPVEKESTK